MNESTLELKELKNIAIGRGITFHPGIGLAKLKARIEMAESREADQEEELIEEEIPEEELETLIESVTAPELKVYRNKTSHNLFTQYGKVIPKGLIKLTDEELTPYKDKLKEVI